MIKIHSNDEILELINNNDMAIVYFTGSACGECEAIKDKVESILETFPKIECKVKAIGVFKDGKPTNYISAIVIVLIWIVVLYIVIKDLKKMRNEKLI